MLILNRLPGEVIIIGDDEIVINIDRVHGQTVSFAIDAPPEVGIWREELLQADDAK